MTGHNVFRKHVILGISRKARHKNLHLLIFAIIVLFFFLQHMGYAQLLDYPNNPRNLSVEHNAPVNKLLTDVTAQYSGTPVANIPYNIIGDDASYFGLGQSQGKIWLVIKKTLPQGSYTVMVTVTWPGPGTIHSKELTINITVAGPPQSPVVVESINPQSPVAVESINPQSPVAVESINPQSPVAVESINPQSPPTPEPEPEPKPRRVRIGYECLVGWQKSDAFGQLTPKVFISAIEVEVNRNQPFGLYKPIAIEIYADPTERRRNLEGWKLTVAVPYNLGRDYHLTADNSVFNADGIARIVSPDANPFPMTDLRYIGQILPGFDYRLFSEKTQRVDIALSCYKGTNARFTDLQQMEQPRVIRNIDLTSLEWENLLFFRSQWRVPVSEAPAAPSVPLVHLVTSWAALKVDKKSQR